MGFPCGGLVKNFFEMIKGQITAIIIVIIMGLGWMCLIGIAVTTVINFGIRILGYLNKNQ